MSLTLAAPGVLQHTGRAIGGSGVGCLLVIAAHDWIKFIHYGFDTISDLRLIRTNVRGFFAVKRIVVYQNDVSITDLFNGDAVLHGLSYGLVQC